MKPFMFFILNFSFLVSLHAETKHVASTTKQTNEKNTTTIVAGTLSLPPSEHWRLVPGSANGNAVGDLLVFLPFQKENPAAEAGEPKTKPEEVTYRVLARLCGQGTVDFTVTNTTTGAALPCRWAIGGDIPDDDEEAIEEWAATRLWKWARATTGSGRKTPLFSALADTVDRVYATDMRDALAPDRRSWRRRDNSTSVFGLLGGQAALQETLQLNPLARGNAPTPATIDIAQVKGVDVASHPYDEMLGGQPGGHLALADFVPADRFFVYAAKPAALRPFLNDGAGFIARAGELATGRAFDYGLVRRYLAKFNMTPEVLDEILKLGIVTEAAFFTSDLFFIDGTEITLVCRIANLKLFTQLLRLPELSGTAPVKVPGAGFHAATVDDLLILGTSKAEVAKVQALPRGEGESLGNSAEFRYMLTQLPVQDTTRLYAYFSDSFIRRLVGPEVKIGQLRRLREKSIMIEFLAAAQLWRLDGQEGEPTLDDLKSKGYLPADADFDTITFTNGEPRSESYGTLADPASLLAIPIATVTSAETNAYETYRANYTRYWRQYFDPIAIRLDDMPDNELELTTFILPLLDHSLYNTLKESLSDTPEKPMRQPVVTPPPPVLFSLNFNDAFWNETLGSLLRGRRAVNASGIMDFINSVGPGLHLAVHDSNPVLAFGSGEMLSLGASVNDVRFELFAQAAVSLLTRPCTVALELQNPAATLALLQSGAVARLLATDGDGDIQNDWYQLTGEDAWILKKDFMGIVLRFKVELSGDFLLIHNIPWNPGMRLDTIPRGRSPAAEVTLRPGAAKEQLKAMFTAAQERRRNNALHGIGYLLPFTAAGASLGDAMAQHKKLFGFIPRHPEGGGWTIENGQITSTLFGNAVHNRQPAFAPGAADTGLLHGIDLLRVGLQFEGTGLRTFIRWNYNVPEKQPPAPAVKPAGAASP